MYRSVASSNLVLVDGVVILRIAIVREMGLESGSEAGVEPVDERLTYADWKGLMVHKRAGGSKDLGIIIVDRREFSSVSSYLCLMWSRAV
jgi:hypothetical protein